MVESHATDGGSTDPLLSVDSIDTYYDESHVLHGLSLEARAGDVVAVLGRNGAGKTTTLRSIMGFTPPREGAIRYQGEDIGGLEPYEIRNRGIALVPEGRGVFPALTVEENLRIATESTAEIDSVYDRFPRLSERETQAAGSLSGGEQQMLAIARGLIGPDTDLLLLDEPTEGLAPQIRDDVRETIREINDDGTTVLIVEQNLAVALDLADRIYLLEGGQIEFSGTRESLYENRDLIKTHLSV